MNGLWLVLGSVAVQMALAEVSISRATHPILGRHETNHLYIQQDTHDLVIQLDVNCILSHLNDIQGIVNHGLDDIDRTFHVDNAAPVASINSSNEKAPIAIQKSDNSWKFFNNVFGKIQLQLSATLLDLQRIKDDFVGFIGLTFVSGRVLEDIGHNSTWGDWRESLLTRHAVIAELGRVTKEKLGELAFVADHKRRKRASKKLNLLARHAGFGISEMQASLIDGKWDLSHEWSVDQKSLFDLFNFTSIMGNTINMTVKYLNKASKLNADLITAVFRSEKQLINTEADLVKVEVVSTHLLNLIRLHFATVDLHQTIELIKKIMVDDGNRLSTFLLEPAELRLYLDRLTHFSGYVPVLDPSANIKLYYLLLHTDREVAQNLLSFRLRIPIRKPDDKLATFKDLTMFDNPFHVGNDVLLLGEVFPRRFVYVVDDEKYFDFRFCSSFEDVSLCEPKVYKKSDCLTSIMSNTNWVNRCNLVKNVQTELFYELWDNIYLFFPREETALKCDCLEDNVINGVQIKIVSSKIAYELSVEVNILEVPKYCKCSLGLFEIPRQGLTNNVTTIEWSFIPPYNVSDLDFSVSWANDSHNGLLSYIGRIKHDFSVLRERISVPSSTELQVKWLFPLQLAHVGLFLVLIIGIGCCVGIKARRHRAKNYFVPQEEVRALNVLNMDESD